MTPTLLGVTAGYLDTARDAGFLDHLDGLPFVAGEYYDEAGGERQCVVECCHPDLLRDGAERLVAALRARFPSTQTVVLRTAADVRMPLPWLAHLTYVRFAGPASPTAAGTAAGTPMPAAPPGSVAVSPAGPEHDQAILAWLVRAFEAYGDQQQHRGDPQEILAAASQVLDAPDRRSYVASVDGRVVGHVTLLCDAFDDVTIGRHVELLDALVDAQPPARSAAIAALTAAAAAHADRLGLPLIGNVVHPTVPEDRARAEAIVRSLLGRGWIVDHRYWRRAPSGEG